MKKMLKANVYSGKGIKKGTYALPSLFSEKENLTLLSQAVRVYEDRLHPGLARVKTRAEVDRTKKKLYRQKGTGGARHGARSAPIFVGGGVAHGPKGVKRILILPSSIKKKALSIALSLKAKEGDVVLLDGVSSFKKTKDAQEVLNKLLKGEFGDKKVKRFTFILSDENWAVAKIIKNIRNVNTLSFKSLNARDVLFGGVLVFDKSVFVKSTKTKKK